MMAWLLRGAIWCLARLPLGVNQRLGATLGWLAWVSHSKLRRDSLLNLELCLDDTTADYRHQLARRSLIETGKALCEAGWIWKRPPAQIESCIVSTRGAELFERACSSGRGVLIATPHLGAWELCNLPVSRAQTVTYLYRAPRQAWLEPLMIRWRANLNAQPATLDAVGIRRVFDVLKRGGIVGVLPDQEPDRDSGVFAPFFGVPANTMFLLARLAHRTRAEVLFCVTERLPGARGWQVHFVEPEPGIADPDKQVATAALNGTIERCIALCPEQYVWNYRRFTQLESGGRRRYGA